MTKRAPALRFSLVALLSGCVQMPHPAVQQPQSARYVDSASLGDYRKYVGVEVLTSVPLRHITAVAAESRLRGNLPEGVRTGRTGRTNAILLQGPGPKVTEALKTLRKIDVR